MTLHNLRLLEIASAFSSMGLFMFFMIISLCFVQWRFPSEKVLSKGTNVFVIGTLFLTFIVTKTTPVELIRAIAFTWDATGWRYTAVMCSFTFVYVPLSFWVFYLFRRAARKRCDELQPEIIENVRAR